MLQCNKGLIGINRNFEKTRLNLAVFLINNLTILVINTLVLLWLKMKENTLVDRMVLLDCLSNIAVIGHNLNGNLFVI